MQQNEIGRNQKIIVFCGPPCSGKSHLHDVFCKKYVEFWCEEMDTLRKQFLPGPINDEAARSTAYRLLHMLAAKRLTSGKSVLLNATYFPPRHRAELAEIAIRLQIPLYVVQFMCSGNEAVARFLRHREKDHAGSDLSVKRVQELADQYERFDGALLINTDKITSPTAQMSLVEEYLQLGTPANPVQWALHEYRSGPWKEAAQNVSATKLSQFAVRSARRRRCLLLGGFCFIAAGTAAGLLSVLLKALWIVKASGWQLASLTKWMLIWVHLPDWIVFATFCIAAAGVASLWAAYAQDISDKWDDAVTITNAGKIPSFASSFGPINFRPSDLEIYYAYYERILPDQREFMPIPNVPVFFCASPSHKNSYEVVVQREKDVNVANSALPDEAAKLGIDWSGFLEWRVAERGKKYHGNYGIEDGLRCTHLDSDVAIHKKIFVRALRCSYSEYLGTDLSSNLCSPGVLTDFRRFLEGPGWYTGNIDLKNITEATRRYSMRISVSALIVTQDGYFILQRRSGAVAEGIGNLNTSAAGASDYTADSVGMRWPEPQKWDVRHTALRETEEEIGLKKQELRSAFNSDVAIPPFDQPFLGAAYNLRHGRDLNFYCCFGTSLYSCEVSARRKRPAAKDRWEVARLEFLHFSKVTTRSIVSGELANLLPARSRHLLGALYAWAVYAGR